MRWQTVFFLILFVVPTGCSDDSNGPASDGKPTGDKGAVDKGSPVDNGVPTGDVVLPWPDMMGGKDATAWKCTPGAAGMCDDNKFYHCKNGTCTLCPANYVDCDRKDDCECLGACKGDKCVGGK
jgi:hypothetical protein